MSDERMSGEHGLREIVRTLASKTGGYERPLWSVVGELMNCGSGTASDVCKRMGFDPDTQVASPQWLDKHQEPFYVCVECGEVDEEDNLLNGLCVDCEQDRLIEESMDEDCDELCPTCLGSGEMPDNGTNLGECDDCCGTGVMT